MTTIQQMQELHTIVSDNALAIFDSISRHLDTVKQEDSRRYKSPNDSLDQLDIRIVDWSYPGPQPDYEVTEGFMVTTLQNSNSSNGSVNIGLWLWLIDNAPMHRFIDIKVIQTAPPNPRFVQLEDFIHCFQPSSQYPQDIDAVWKSWQEQNPVKLGPNSSWCQKCGGRLKTISKEVTKRKPSGWFGLSTAVTKRKIEQKQCSDCGTKFNKQGHKL